jgi:hypothetical protein
VLSRYLAPPIVEVRCLFGALVSEALLVSISLNQFFSLPLFVPTLFFAHDTPF